MYQTYTRTGFRGKGLSIPAVHQRWLILRVDILPSDLQSNGIDQACPRPRWRNQSKDFASSYTNLLKNGQIWTQGRYAGRPPRRAIIRKLATYYGQGIWPTWHPGCSLLGASILLKEQQMKLLLATM